eukprot:TRINITY_DN17321_c0_g3_i1.p1 TRINITY_DN17321_c0_g3~~TRINITY_DN17321_c0_g3_i1.p1  ORF type:complete len:255 (+),score=51.48 TRINITY_DN17321_c0_g3_i1:238-1002(+)
MSRQTHQSLVASLKAELHDKQQYIDHLEAKNALYWKRLRGHELDPGVDMGQPGGHETEPSQELRARLAEAEDRCRRMEETNLQLSAEVRQLRSRPEVSSAAETERVELGRCKKEIKQLQEEMERLDAAARQFRERGRRHKLRSEYQGQLVQQLMGTRFRQRHQIRWLRNWRNHVLQAKKYTSANNIATGHVAHRARQAKMRCLWRLAVHAAGHHWRSEMRTARQDMETVQSEAGTQTIVVHNSRDASDLSLIHI